MCVSARCSDGKSGKLHAVTDLLTAGRKLKGFELLAPIARGGMGTVWLARMDTQGSRLVAVKTIVSQYRAEPKFRDMFLDEARISALIDHPNVARILELGEDGGVLFYAMEYIDGDPLRRLQQALQDRGQPLPINIALRVCADACAGLHAAHETRDANGNSLDVVHRDVSPHNILIASNGAVKIIDFGVAKAQNRIVAESTAGTFKGKIDFMAPEQARGGHIDRRADVYAIGASLFHLITGHAVYDSTEGRQLAALHELISGAPRAQLPSSVPNAVRMVIDRALEHDADQRFATCDELRIAIEHAMVASGETATAQDVAHLLDSACPDRAAERGNLIRVAIRAAEERAPVGEPMDPAGSSLLGAEMTNNPPEEKRRPTYSTPLMALSGVVLGVVILFVMQRAQSDADPEPDVAVHAIQAPASSIPRAASPPPNAENSIPAIPVVSGGAIVSPPVAAPSASATAHAAAPPAEPQEHTTAKAVATPPPNTRTTTHSSHSSTKATKPKGSTNEYGF